jgi:hypothetical protein
MEKRLKTGEDECESRRTRELWNQVSRFQSLYRPANIRALIEEEKKARRVAVETLSGIDTESNVHFVAGVSAWKIEELKKGNYVVQISFDRATVTPPTVDKYVIDEARSSYWFAAHYEPELGLFQFGSLAHFEIPNPISALFHNHQENQICAALKDLSDMYLKHRLPPWFIQFRILDEENDVTYNTLQDVANVSRYRVCSTEIRISTALDDTSVFDSFTTTQILELAPTKTDAESEEVEPTCRWVCVQARTVHLLRYFSFLSRNKVA